MTERYSAGAMRATDKIAAKLQAATVATAENCAAIISEETGDVDLLAALEFIVINSAPGSVNTVHSKDLARARAAIASAKGGKT